MHKQSFFKFFLILLFAFSTPVILAAKISTIVDRKEITKGSAFHLIFSTNGKLSAVRPDFSILRNSFNILGSSKSSRVTIINGETTTTSEWVITLEALKTGEVTIPSIQFGDTQSDPIKITVKKISANKIIKNERKVFLNATIDNKSPYTQSQVLYKVKLFYAVSLSRASLSDPHANDAIIMRLGDDKRYQIHLNGQLYKVLERDYAIFPQKSGTLNITPPKFQGLMSAEQDYFSRMDPMFSTGKSIKLKAPAIKLAVKSIPSEISQNNWLPTKKLTIQESWQKSQASFKVGDPITRTIIIKADGITANQLPDLPVQNAEGANTYPDKPISTDSLAGTKIVAKRIQKIAYIPTKSGELTLPAVSVSWWNTEKNQIQVAKLPSRQIQIAATVTQTNQLASTNNNNKQNIENSSAEQSHFLPWIVAALFFVAWLITLVLWRYQPRKSKHQNENPIEPSLRTARKAIKRACSQNSPTECKQALLLWAKMQWPNNSPQSLLAITQMIDDKKIAKVIYNLDENLYKNDNNEWSGRVFWETFQNFQPEQKKQKQTNELPELYPY